MTESKYEESNAVQSLEQHSDLKLFFNKDEKTIFEVEPEHMLREIAAPLTAQDVSGCSFSDLMEIFKGVTVTNEMLDIWRGYQDSQLFQSESHVRNNLNTYTSYVESAKDD